jgi:hypothetical protein
MGYLKAPLRQRNRKSPGGAANVKDGLGTVKMAVNLPPAQGTIDPLVPLSVFSWGALASHQSRSRSKSVPGKLIEPSFVYFPALPFSHRMDNRV